MTNDIPQWALTRAWEEVRACVPNEAFNREAPKAWMETFARYIAAHEDPPVDPLLVEAREVCALDREESGAPSLAAAHREGRCDDAPLTTVALRALKRGMELARESQP